MERFGESHLRGRRHQSSRDEAVKLGTAGRWTQQCDRPVVVSDNQVLSSFHAPKVRTQVLSQLGYADTGFHVHNGSTFAAAVGQPLARGEDTRVGAGGHESLGIGRESQRVRSHEDGTVGWFEIGRRDVVARQDH